MRTYAKAEPTDRFPFISPNARIPPGQNIPNEGGTKRSMIDDLLRFADEL